MTALDHLEADRLVRRRARLWPVLAILLCLQQASVFFLDPSARSGGDVAGFQSGVWLGLSLATVAALWTGGYWFKRRAVRNLLDDEVTRAHRADALAFGFLLAMVMSLALYVASMFDLVEIRGALHILVTTTLVGALLRFSFLEWRALRDG